MYKWYEARNMITYMKRLFMFIHATEFQLNETYGNERAKNTESKEKWRITTRTATVWRQELIHQVWSRMRRSTHNLLFHCTRPIHTRLHTHTERKKDTNINTRVHTYVRALPCTFLRSFREIRGLELLYGAVLCYASFCCAVWMYFLSREPTIYR